MSYRYFRNVREVPNNFMLQNKPKKSVKKLVLLSLLLPSLSLSSTVALAENNLKINTVQTNAKETLSKDKLMDKLSKLAFFTANFRQKIMSHTGEVLSLGDGRLAISKPNLVNWQTISPDETHIISDGNTLWFYDPFIEQVSAYSLAKSIHNTPILLLTSDEPSLWQQYRVTEEKLDTEANFSQKAQRFVITPKDATSQIKQLTLTFTIADFAGVNDSQLSQFSFQDATGQVSQIDLSNFNSKDKPQASLFSFSLPEGVRLEDKR